MSATPTYSPLIPQNPNALFGILNSEFGIAAPHFVFAQPTPNSQLLTPNWTFTFSAKERDPETGLSYFGSRYYSSDLSIWLSVDPMSDKYAYQSGYVYCGNNPIKVVDPNGEDEWEFDESGNLNWVKESEFDSFHKIDKDGNRTGESLYFDRKIVSNRFNLGDDHESSYIRIDNANDADEVFSFLSDNVELDGAEFSNSMVQDNYGNIFNLIGSDIKAQVGKNYSIRNLLKSEDYTVLECTHNHFANKVSPSGPDVYWADKYPNTLFMIRTANDYCTPYDRNTQPDYDFGTPSVTLPVKRVIIN